MTLSTFCLFVINSFVVGIIGIVYLFIKRILSKLLSPSVTYYISLIILFSAVFPFGCLFFQNMSFTNNNKVTIRIAEITQTINHSNNNSKEYSALIYIWILISSVLLLKMCIKHIKLLVSINRWKKPSKYTSKLMKNVSVYSCCIITTPMLKGIIKNELIIPEIKMSEDVFELICAHEKKHYIRHDVFIRMLVMIIGILNWFNPLLWLLIIDNQYDCETSCDLYAKQILSQSELNRYCNALLGLASNKIDISLISFSGGYRIINHRLNALRNNKDNRLSAFVLLIVVTLSLIFVNLICATNKSVEKDSVIVESNKSNNDNRVEIIVNDEKVTSFEINNHSNDSYEFETSADEVQYTIISDNKESQSSFLLSE